MIQNILNFNSIKNSYKTSSRNKYNNQQIWHYNNKCDSISFKGKNKNMQTNSTSIEDKIAKINNAFSQEDVNTIATVIKKISLYDFDELMRNLETYKYCGDNEASFGYNFDLKNNISSVSFVNRNDKTVESEICTVQISDFSKILDLLKESCS